MKQHGKPLDPAFEGFGHQQNGSKSLFEGVSQLLADLFEFLGLDLGKPVAQDFLDLA